MTYKPLTEAVDLYRSGEASLKQAADEAGVSSEELAAELRSEGVELADEDQGAVATTRY